VSHAWQHVNVAIRRSLEDISLAQLAGLERVALRSPDLSGTAKTEKRLSEVPLVRLARSTQD
jgi:hypothetical protein